MKVLSDKLGRMRMMEQVSTGAVGQALLAGAPAFRDDRHDVPLLAEHEIAPGFRQRQEALVDSRCRDACPRWRSGCIYYQEPMFKGFTTSGGGRRWRLSLMPNKRVDAQGLPVVTWEEDRNLFAPEGAGPARVACFIRPDEKTGVLQFVSAGSVRHGAFEEARPWELLKSFQSGTADQLYYAASDRAALDLLASKSKSGAGRLLATDGAQVMLANFADERASCHAFELRRCLSGRGGAAARPAAPGIYCQKRPCSVDGIMRRRIYLAEGQAVYRV